MSVAKSLDEVTVAATGPSLDPAKCRGFVIAVNDAYRLLPDADILYACDARWWDYHNPQFKGQKWSSHNPSPRINDNKADAARKHGLHLVPGFDGEGFKLDFGIHYGSNSGFQAVNLAIALGARRIRLVGFDMHGRHFFGDHPKELGNPDFPTFIAAFERAAELLPSHIEIVNCTPDSALTCFPFENES